ncbi:MAG TPA: biotin/lipoyl-containing protein, partial [Pseudomonadales bacterium]|nr:biotin/lipoyl-containing protein [Pseudomonadales bacterium]
MSEFRMPSLGADMDAATLIQWLVKPGDAVKKGDVILVVETNKGAIEVEVFQSGVIEKLLVAEQTKVPVGTPLALIRGEAETQPITPAISTPVSPAVAAARPAPIRTPDNAVANAARQYASPAARKQAARQQIRLAEIKGSGPSGAVVLKDVAQKPTASATEKAKPGFNADAMRQAIAAAMARSKREIPHYYLATQVDMSSAQTWLENYNAERPPEERLLLS